MDCVDHVLGNFGQLLRFVHVCTLFRGCPPKTCITPYLPFLETETLGKWINLDLLPTHVLFGSFLGWFWTVVKVVTDTYSFG